MVDSIAEFRSPLGMGKLTNLTVKGQVTIPKDGRDAIGHIANEPVEIEMLGADQAVIRRSERDHAVEHARLVAEMRAAARRFAPLRENRPTEDIMRDVRGDDAHWP